MSENTIALRLRGLTKRYGQTLAVNSLDLDVPRGSFYGFVGPNGAGKTTTLSMATGLLVPDAGVVEVVGVDLWREPERAKRHLGVLPDGMRMFDRLTGAELISYTGLLQGLDPDTVKERTGQLLEAFGLAGDGGKMVADYSAGMTKKVGIACALVHAPAVLALDEPFEAVDPVSRQNMQQILAGFVAQGGTVIMSSHVMDLVQRTCDHVAVIDFGRILAAGTTADVAAGKDLEDRFVELVGGRATNEELTWLRPS